MQLRWQLQMIRKGALTTDAYISGARELINHVIPAGDVINPCEQVLYVMGCLDLAYVSLMTSITNKKHIPCLDEVFSKMIIHEQQLASTPAIPYTSYGSTSLPFLAWNFNALPNSSTPYLALLFNTTHNQILYA